MIAVDVSQNTVKFNSVENAACPVSRICYTLLYTEPQDTEPRDTQHAVFSSFLPK